MRYLGSKTSSANEITKLVLPRVSEGSFCDPFGGIGVVGARFKACGFQVTTGDILRNAYHFQVARIVRNRLPAFDRLRNSAGIDGHRAVVKLLNSVTERKGWFEREYSLNRRFFMPENGRRIGACRNLIRTWSREGLLTPSEKSVLLASLVDSMDRVANTAGTYYAYLKNWYRKSLRPFHFELIQPSVGHSGCKAHCCSADDLLRDSYYDVLYLDPPYNSRRYGSYYHLPETVALDHTPKVRGMAGIGSRHVPTSLFNSRESAVLALAGLLSSVSFRLLVFHYADDGLIDAKSIRRVLKEFGSLDEVTLNARGYSTDCGTKTIRQRVYIVQKNG